MTIVLWDIPMSFSNEFEESVNPPRNVRANGNLRVESRADRLARIRAEIAAGEYDTPERFEAALERMLDRLDVSLS